MVAARDGAGNRLTRGGANVTVFLGCAAGQCASGSSGGGNIPTLSLANVFVMDHLNGSYTVSYVAKAAG